MANHLPEFTIVVPLYNEEGNVKLLQEEIAGALTEHPYQLVLVDDGSTDDTANCVQKADNVTLIELEKNTGQSAAMYAGIHAVTTDVIVLIDGDLQNDPADIPKLVEQIGDDVDLVCGYRAERKDTTFKRLQSRIANGVRSRFTGDGVRDTGCTLKAMKRECREALLPFTGMHRFIPALIKGSGYKLIEVPVNHRARQHGESKYGFGNRAFRATADMFAVKWLLSRRFFHKVKS